MLRVLVPLLLLIPVSWAQERPNLRTILLGGRPFTFVDHNGLALTDGDIVVGRTADLEALADKDGQPQRNALVVLDNLGSPPLWPGATIPYVIDASVGNTRRIEDAVAYWNDFTPLRLVPHAGEEDYVRFVAQSGVCASSAGRVRGQQFVWLDEGCSTGSVIHEIGHAFGLLHEHSRSDRNAWVTTFYENIDTTYYSQYGQVRSSRDIGDYDYDSTMHYPAAGFSFNGKNTQATHPPGIPIGQRLGLSATDIDSISRLYGFLPTRTTITTVPEGLSVIVDGERYFTPVDFDWAPGSPHEISTDDFQGPFGNNVFRYVRWTDGGERSHVFTASADRTVVSAQFQQRVQLITRVSGSGTISVQPASADGYYVAGTELRITAVPAAGQQFQFWSGAGTFASQGFGSGAATLRVELNSTAILTATFTALPVTTIDSFPAGRLVVVDGLQYVTPVRFAWTAGSTHTLNVRVPQSSVSAATRYRYVGWEDGNTEALRTITAGTQSATYKVRFLEQHWLDFSRIGSGSLSVDPPQDSGYIDAGTTVTLRATPLPGQAVQYWMGDVAGDGATKALLMDRPRRAVAVLGPALPFRLTNSASFQSNPSFEQPGLYVAPLEMVTLFGPNLGPPVLAQGSVAGGRLATEAGGTRVLFDGVPAPVLHAVSNQATVIVPAEVAGKNSVTVTVERNGQPSAVAIFGVVPTLPGLFTNSAAGSGQVVAYNQDGSRNSKDRPAPRGSFVTVIATGGGLMDRAYANGEITDANLSRPQAAVFARIGREPAGVAYAGSAPGNVAGVLQLNVQVPGELEPGEWPIRLVVGDAMSPPGVTIAVQ